jgi:hypothetical protein
MRSPGHALPPNLPKPVCVQSAARPSLSLLLNGEYGTSANSAGAASAGGPQPFAFSALMGTEKPMLPTCVAASGAASAPWEGQKSCASCRTGRFGHTHALALQSGWRATGVMQRGGNASWWA